MKIHNCTQGELEWVRLRLGKPTASEFKQFITPTFAFSNSAGMRTLVYKKVAEAIRRQPLPTNSGGGSFSTEQGQILEQEARSWYEMEHDTEVRQVGFIESDDSLCGCSPDGLCEGYGLEIKCPFPQTHVEYLDSGELPEDYSRQVHGSLFVTGYSEWRFLSYCRGFKPFLLTVQRDEAIAEKIASAVTKFHAEFTRVLSHVTTK